MKQTKLSPPMYPYHFENCTISRLVIKHRTMTLLFLDGFYKGEEKVGGYLTVSNINRDSFLYYKRRKHALNKEQLDLTIQGLTIGAGYLMIIGESRYGECLLCLHHLGEITVESVS